MYPIKRKFGCISGGLDQRFVQKPLLRNDMLKNKILDACEKKKISNVDTLLSIGANIETSNILGNTLLNISVSEKNDIPMCSLLLTKKADINQLGDLSSGNTSLMEAIRNNNDIMVDLLLEKKADITVTNYDGINSLLYCLRRHF